MCRRRAPLEQDRDGLMQSHGVTQFHFRPESGILVGGLMVRIESRMGVRIEPGGAEACRVQRQAGAG